MSPQSVSSLRTDEQRAKRNEYSRFALRHTTESRGKVVCPRCGQEGILYVRRHRNIVTGTVYTPSLEVRHDIHTLARSLFPEFWESWLPEVASRKDGGASDQ